MATDIQKKWPYESERTLPLFYGPVGTHQTLLELPYPMVLAWETQTIVKKISCHEKCADTFRVIFEDVLEHYGIDQIKLLRLNLFGGCLNVRKIRGGTGWSTHAYGCAIDLDPDHNQLKWGKDKASFAKKDYDKFWEIVESHGGYSLGREKNYDYMHFQLCWR